MKSHCDGEAWGLGITEEDCFVTSGDDNQIFSWSIKDRKVIATSELCDEEMKTEKEDTSSLTQYSPSKCARAVAVC
jgi:hypothetical protein